MIHNFDTNNRYVKTHGVEKLLKGIDLYQNNVSLREIEKQLHLPRNRFSKFLTEIGVKTTVGNHYRKYFHDENFFENIDSEEKAYWLGFMYADGYIVNNEDRYGEKRIGITLSLSDKGHLEKFKKSIKSTNPIKEYPNYTKEGPYANGKGTCRILCTSEKTAQDLIEKGCGIQKTHKLTFPTKEQVPESLIPDFIRGYLDGDGSITYTKKTDSFGINILGTESFIRGLQGNMLFWGTIFPDKRTPSTWIYGVGGNNQVLLELKRLYGNATIYLDRKYERFVELCKKYDENQGTIE